MVISAIQSTAQDDKRPIFVGVQPDVTVEPFYDENEFDVNVFPFIVQLPLGARIDMRLNPLVNYHFGNPNELGELGLYFIAPVYIKKRAERSAPSSGFSVGPVLGLVRSIRTKENKMTLALEPGYMFKTSKKFTVGLGAQFGTTYFNADSGSDRWDSHLGFKVQVGFWL